MDTYKFGQKPSRTGSETLSALRAFYSSEWDMNQAMMQEKRDGGGGLLDAAERLLDRQESGAK